ncbi:MAG: hypothetical protein AB1798_12020, partial [Spirochaetota bacterium]
SGFYTFIGLTDTISQYENYNFYFLFLLPLLRIALILASSVFVARALSLYSFGKAISIVGSLCMTLICALVSLLFRFNYQFLAILVTGVFSAGVGCLFFFLDG